MKKALALFLALYLSASLTFSACHAFVSNRWEFRSHRNGLLCVEITEHDFVIYSPFCNHGDVFLLVVQYDPVEGWRFASDGLGYFGEWFDC